jgi:hypothetical protein
MLTQSEQPRPPELDVIARDTSLYVWLLTVTKPRKQAAPLPQGLRADLGLPPVPPMTDWAAAHARDR